MMRRRNVLFAGIPVVLIAAFMLGEAARGSAAQQQAVQAPIFEVDPLWPKPLPNHWLLGSAVGVAVDSRDHVFVIHLTNSFNQRTEIGAASNPPTGECCVPAPNVLEFDPDGNLVAHFGGPGEGYAWPVSNHGLAIDPDGNPWIGGSGGTDSHLLKFSREGRFLLEVGKVGVAPPAAAGGGREGGGGGGGGRGGRGAGPALPPNSSSIESFGGPAEISFDAGAGEAFVADGYRNRRVAVIDTRTGAVKRFWGAYGNRPEDADSPTVSLDRVRVTVRNPDAPPPRQFGTPVRCAELTNDGFVYVCDRSNNRVQVFRKDGTFVKEKAIAPRTRGAGSVWDVAFSRDPQQRFLYVADGMNMKVHILDRQSLEVLTSIGDGGRQPGQFFAVHSLATDSKGNLYTTETYEGKRVQKFLFKGIGDVQPNAGVVWPRTGGAR